MASITAGEILGYRAPGAGETVRLPVMMLDSAGAAVTGIAFDAAGVTVKTKKEGASSFTAWPTFVTGNWDEIGYGLYEVIISQSDAEELALLDTPGTFALYVKFTATRGDVFLYKVNPADVTRDDQWTDAKADYLTNAIPTVAQIWAAATSALTTEGSIGLALVTLIGKFTGITSLTAWLRGLYRKSTMDATAKSEVNTGGGTYDEATDSQEALREKADTLSTYAGGAATPGDVADALTGYGAAQPGDEMDLVDDSVDDDSVADYSKFKANVSSLALEATLTAMKGAGWTDETMVAILAAVESISGAGVNTVTATFTDDNDDPIAGIWVRAKVGAQSFWAKTDTAGIATYHLADGDYEFWPASSSVYIWNAGAGYYEGTVSGDTDLAFEAELTTIPASTDPALCTCYLDIRLNDGAGALVGANDGWMKVLTIDVPSFPDAATGTAYAQAKTGTTYYTNAQGRVSAEFIRGSVVTVEFGTVDGDDYATKSFTVSAAASANITAL